MKKFALLVGINDYDQGSGLTSLRYAEDDVRALERELKDRYGFNTRLLLGREATQRAIDQVLYTCGSGDLFLFFFAGHGQEIKGHYHLHPADSQASGLGAIGFDTFARHWRQEFGYGKVLAILDACRNEFDRRSRGGARGFGSRRDIEHSLENGGQVEIIYGCEEGQVSYEDESLGHGLLTHSLLQVLKNSPPALDCFHLACHAGDTMRTWCRQSGKGWNQQAMWYGPSTMERIVLVERGKFQGSTRQDGDSQAHAEAKVSPLLVVCPLCGRRNDEQNTFMCHGCGKDYCCLSHQDPEVFVCIRCFNARQQASRVEAPGRDEANPVEPRPSEVWAEPYTDPKMVSIPGGSFEMGQSPVETATLKETAGIVWGLSAPLSQVRFREQVKLLFGENQELTPRMLEELRVKADEFGVHQLDYETILLKCFFTKPVEEFIMVRRQAILWPKSANLAGSPRSWKAARDFMDELNEQMFGGYTTWRLPRIEELRGLMEPLLFLGVKKYFAAKLLGIGFTSVQSNVYWSGSVGAADNSRPYCLNLKFGGVSRHMEDRQHYVWPVAEFSDKHAMEK